MQKTKRILLPLLAVLLLLTCACSGKRQEQKVIGTCSGYEVLYEELRYVTLTYKDMFEATYGKGIWDTPESAEQYRAELEETVWRVMLNNYAVLAACQNHGITAEDFNSDVIQAAVDADVEDVIESYGGEKAFEAALKELYMTEHFLRFCLTVAQLENELMYALTDIDMIEDDANEFMTWIEEGNGVYVQHVFIENDEGEDPEVNRQTAQDIRTQLLNGADIANFVGSAVNEDLQNVAPYYIVRDVYTEEMETAALALQNVGDVSEVVETADGFYVLVRIEETRDENGENLTLLSKISSLLVSYQWARVEEYVETYKADLNIELNEYGKSIDLLEIE